MAVHTNKFDNDNDNDDDNDKPPKQKPEMIMIINHLSFAWPANTEGFPAFVSSHQSKSQKSVCVCTSSLQAKFCPAHHTCLVSTVGYTCSL